jgi:DNA modification methylase
METMRESLTLVTADIRDASGIEANASLDGAILDPPYGLGLTGAAWDNNAISFDVEFWSQVGSKIKPGGTIAVFGHARTAHRLGTAVEDSGLRIVDHLAWAKGHGHATASRAIDGELRKQGSPPELSNKFMLWETLLRSAYEPVLIARQLKRNESLVQAIANGGAGGFNVGATLIPADPTENRSRRPGKVNEANGKKIRRPAGMMSVPNENGRKPGNLILEHDEGCQEMECMVTCQISLIDAQGRGKYRTGKENPSRLFTQIKYSARAHSSESPHPEGTPNHPTVKPRNLINWLCDLIVMPGGTYLDGFAGSGAVSEGIIAAGGNAWAVEREPEFIDLIEARFAALDSENSH